MLSSRSRSLLRPPKQSSLSSTRRFPANKLRCLGEEVAAAEECVACSVEEADLVAPEDLVVTMDLDTDLEAEVVSAAVMALVKEKVEMVHPSSSTKKLSLPK
jgi:hypothetical protein